MKQTLNAALDAVRARQPDAPAFWYEGNTITWNEFDARIGRVAAGFRKLGIGQGDVVSLWLPNTPAWLVCFFALARIGAMALATNTRFRSGELKDILYRSGAKAVVYWPGYRGIDFVHVLHQVVEDLSALKHLVLYTEQSDEPAGSHAGFPQQLTEYASLESTVAGDQGGDAATPDTPCLLFTTSGTTSRPKLVVHVQHTIPPFALDVAREFRQGEPGARTLQVVPFCGTYGFVQTVAAIFSGTPMALHHSFDAAESARLIRQYGVTLMGATDEMIRRLYAHETAPIPFPGIKLICGSRAPELAGLSRERGFHLISAYGSSEVQALFSRRPDSDEPEQRAVGGGVPVSLARGAAVRVRDQETGQLMDKRGQGEVEIKGPSLFSHYLNDTEATRKAFTEDGWFRTGDLGFMDEAEHSWTFLTRIGDALRLSGFLVNPMEIETYVREHAGVDLCYVVGVDHQSRTTVVAFYTSASGAPVDEAALREHCTERMARYKVPAHFVHVKEFPMIASMNTAKLDRKLLRERALALLTAS